MATTEITVEVHVLSATSALVSGDGEDLKNSVWLPLSEIEFDRDVSAGDTAAVTIPEWLATRTGLV